MEYDKRIINTSLILDCFKTTWVKENGYKDKFGYFTNCIDSYADLDKCRYGKLTDISDDTETGHIPYQVDSDRYYGFFLPEGATEPEKKEYKPFDSATFEKCYDVGSVIIYRNKKEKHRIYKAIVTSITRDYMENVFYIVMRGYTYTLDELFIDYEICEFGEWKPFGVEE